MPRPAELVVQTLPARLPYSMEREAKIARAVAISSNAFTVRRPGQRLSARDASPAWLTILAKGMPSRFQAHVRRRLKIDSAGTKERTVTGQEGAILWVQ